MTDWTDRRRPVLARAEEWRTEAVKLGWSLMFKVYPNDTAQLLHDLAAVLRAGVEWECVEPVRDGEDLLRAWQHLARDPETGERMFP